MMSRFFVVYVIFIVFAAAGCSFVSKSSIAEQAWSENFATAEGVEATSPLMIDGDMSTIGETQTPIGMSTRTGATEFTEAFVKFPEKRSIRRIVFSTPNIRSFSIYAAGEKPDDWRFLEEIKNNEEKKIAVNVSAVTNEVKIKVRKTSDDKLIPGARGSRKQMQHAKGKIQEIEIYGLVEKSPAQATEQAVAPGTSGAPARKAEEKPKAPPAILELESPQDTYALAGPVPVKVSLKIGSDDLVVLADAVSDEMLRTKLLVKAASGEKIACSKPIPPISNPRPYRGSDQELSVRVARTLEANSVITVDIPNLLEYYPIKSQGNYTIQLDMDLEVHDKFVGRNQTQIEDRERTIRDINARANYTPAEKASLIQELRGEIEQLKQKKDSRYLVVGTKSIPLSLNSNVLTLVIQ